MNVEQRILTCRLLEKMRNREAYSKKLGLENFSTFQGMPITMKSGEVQRKSRGL